MSSFSHQSGRPHDTSTEHEQQKAERAGASEHSSPAAAGKSSKLAPFGGAAEHHALFPSPPPWPVFAASPPRPSTQPLAEFMRAVANSKAPSAQREPAASVPAAAPPAPPSSLLPAPQRSEQAKPPPASTPCTHAGPPDKAATRIHASQVPAAPDRTPAEPDRRPQSWANRGCRTRPSLKWPSGPTGPFTDPFSNRRLAT